MKPPSRRTTLVLILGPVLSSLVLALGLTALGASDDVALGVGLPPLLLIVVPFLWIAVGSRHDMQEFAAERGWSFEGDHQLARPPRGAPFTGAAPDFTVNFATGDREGRTYQAFEHYASTRGHPPFTCVMTLLDTPAPFVNVAKRAWLDRPTNPEVGREVALGDHAFDRRMRVRTENVEFARAVLTPPARELLLANRDLVVRLDSELAVAFRLGTPSVELLERLLAHLEGLLTIMEVR